MSLWYHLDEDVLTMVQIPVRRVKGEELTHLLSEWGASVSHIFGFAQVEVDVERRNVQHLE